MTERLLSADARAVALGDLPLADGTVHDGTPVAGHRELGRVGDAEVGVWELTPGVVSDVETDEIFVVLSGRATVDFASGESLELGPGSAVRLHAGDVTRWTVHETLRKIYVVTA